MRHKEDEDNHNVRTSVIKNGTKFRQPAADNYEKYQAQGWYKWEKGLS